MRLFGRKLSCASFTAQLSRYAALQRYSRGMWIMGNSQMKALAELVFISEIVLQSKIAERAAERLVTCEDHFDPIETWSAIQSILVAAANVSKILGPPAKDVWGTRQNLADATQCRWPQSAFWSQNKKSFWALRRANRKVVREKLFSGICGYENRSIRIHLGTQPSQSSSWL